MDFDPKRKRTPAEIKTATDTQTMWATRPQGRPGGKKFAAFLFILLLLVVFLVNANINEGKRYEAEQRALSQYSQTQLIATVMADTPK